MSYRGTSIYDLQKKRGINWENQQDMNQYENLKRLQQMQYNNMQNLQYDQGYNAVHNIHQIQQSPYYKLMNDNYTEQTHMEDLARDISNNMPSDNFISGISEISEDKITNKSDGGIIYGIPEILREPLILVILYVILSLPVVRENIGKHIKQINPDVEGKVSFTGILIYGIILATLFALVKRLLLK